MKLLPAVTLLVPYPRAVRCLGHLRAGNGMQNRCAGRRRQRIRIRPGLAAGRSARLRLTLSAHPFGVPGAHGGPGFGCWSSMKLIGDCPTTHPSGGQPMRYRFTTRPTGSGGQADRLVIAPSRGRATVAARDGQRRAGIGSRIEPDQRSGRHERPPPVRRARAAKVTSVHYWAAEARCRDRSHAPKLPCATCQVACVASAVDAELG